MSFYVQARPPPRWTRHAWEGEPCPGVTDVLQGLGLMRYDFGAEEKSAIWADALALVAKWLRGEAWDVSDIDGAYLRAVMRYWRAFERLSERHELDVGPDRLLPFAPVLCSRNPLVCGTPHLRGLVDAERASVLFTYHKKPSISDRLRSAAYARGPDGGYTAALRYVACLDDAEEEGSYTLHLVGGRDPDAGEDFLHWRSCLDVWKLRGGNR